MLKPYIPEYITVHLGSPSSNAENLTISFIDYIKNVASSEIYPTWNDSALTANIYAQISFALNRVYLEHYRSQGYNFNITNSPLYDQSFNWGRNTFENTDRIVDFIFNEYIRRIGFIEPLAAKYCNGTTVVCTGLSQWGSQSLALQGSKSIEILKYYYGDNIEIVKNAPISGIINSYPGYPIKKGDQGNYVVIIQNRINRISFDYPSIPKINPVDGIFGTNTENSVKRFQEIFNLDNDGIVGKSTWYKINTAYTSIARLNELDSEGLKLFGLTLKYPDAISYGDSGSKVSILQYFLAILSEFYENIPPVKITGQFGDETKNSVIAFQQYKGLPETGVVDDITWNKIYKSYVGIVNTFLIPYSLENIITYPFPGETLRIGSSGESVKLLQEYLSVISTVIKSIPNVKITGTYNQQTMYSVIEYQDLFGIKKTGTVDRETWNSITNTYRDILSASKARPTQYPGFILKEGMND